VALTNGQIKIVDFGIARVGVSSMTMTGQVLGTVMYMSPEQVQGQKVDARSDVFSLGIVLYELLTYQKPFTGEDVPTIFFKILNEPPEPIFTYLPQCPAELEKIVQRALAKDRNQRYQSTEDMAFDLQRVADSLKRDTVEVYLQQGQLSLQNKDFTVAKECLQRVLEIDSSHEVAKNLLSAVRESIQAQQRTQKVEEHLRQAREAIQLEHYEDAIGLLEETLLLEPSNQDAQSCKKLAVEQRDRREKIRRHLERAEGLAGKAEFPRAKVELESLLAIDPENTAARSMMDWVVKELTEQERLRQVREYLEGARTRFAEMNFAKANELLDKAREIDPGNIEIQALTQMVRSAEEKEERRKLLVKRIAEIEDKLGKNELDLAAAFSDEALRAFPDDPQVIRIHAQVLRRVEINKRRTYVDEQLQAARDLLQKNEHAAARAVLEKACETVPEDHRLAAYLKTVLEAQEQAALGAARQEAIREANNQIRADNFAAAIEGLEKSLARSGQSAEVMDLLQFARERLADQQREEQIRSVLSRAQNSLREEQYDEAMQILSRAPGELKSMRIDALLATAKEQRAAFESRRDETIAQALKLLEAGEATKAVALFEAVPKAFFKNNRFQRVYSQCRQSLDRANFVRTTVEQIRKCLVEDDTSLAESLLKQALESYPDDATLKSQEKLLREAVVRRERLTLLEEAQLALGHMEYARATKLLQSVSWESSNLPDLEKQAKSLLEEVTRRQREHEALAKAQNYLRDEQYDEAVQFLARASEELKSEEITALLAAAHERKQGFERRRDEIISRALQLLQAGEAAKAVASFNDAPKIYFKNGNFQKAYSLSRQMLDRANFVRTASEQINACLAQEDLGAAEWLLEQALKAYPDETTFLALRDRWQEEGLRLRREERVKLLEEAQVAVVRMEFQRATELLTSVEWDSPDLPDLAAQANGLLEEAKRRESEPGTPRLVAVPAKRKERRSAEKPGPAPEIAAAKKSWMGLAAILVLVAVTLAVAGAWYVRSRNAPGYVQLTAVPWGEVADVSNTNGTHLKITGQTPVRLALPPGKYVIELKNGQTSCKVQATVERGAVTAYSCTFPEVKVDDMVQKILAAY